MQNLSMMLKDKNEYIKKTTYRKVKEILEQYDIEEFKKLVFNSFKDRIEKSDYYQKTMVSYHKLSSKKKIDNVLELKESFIKVSDDVDETISSILYLANIGTFDVKCVEINSDFIKVRLELITDLI